MFCPSLLAGVSDMQHRADGSSEIFSEDVLRFNEIQSTAGSESNSEEGASTKRISNFSEAFQVQVLRLVLSLVILEQVMMQKREEKLSAAAGASGPAAAGYAAAASTGHETKQAMRYLNDQLIPDQPMFLCAIKEALKQDRIRHLHSHWTRSG